jgi:hypothetical protein
MANVGIIIQLLRVAHKLMLAKLDVCKAGRGLELIQI